MREIEAIFMTDSLTPKMRPFIPSQDFVKRNISCEFDNSNYNTLCYRGPTKVLAQSKKNAHGGRLFFSK